MKIVIIYYNDNGYLELGYYMDNETIKLGKRPLFTPAGKIYVVGDVHGERFKLKSLWHKIKQQIKPEDYLVFCGDYVDVGPNVPETLKLLQQIKNEHENTEFIEGNHDEMMKHSMKGDFTWWYANKGGKTMVQFEKYGLDNPSELAAWFLKENITFLDNLIPYYETDLVLITHAPIPSKLYRYGLDEGVLERLDEEIRWNFVDHEKKAVEQVPNKLFVCGHQNGFGRFKAPRLYPEVNRIYLDSGAGYHLDAPLSCVVVYPFDKIKTNLSG
jgi:predicted MPP superfamily phosphohydrolase